MRPSSTLTTTIVLLGFTHPADVGVGIELFKRLRRVFASDAVTPGKNFFHVH